MVQLRRQHLQQLAQRKRVLVQVEVDGFVEQLVVANLAHSNKKTGIHGKQHVDRSAWGKREHLIDAVSHMRTHAPSE